MTFDFVDVLVIVTCVAVLCRQLYWFAVIAPRSKEVLRVLRKFAVEAKELAGEGEKIMSSISSALDQASRAGSRMFAESAARTLLKEDVELMKQWTHDAFIASLNRQPPPEVPEKIIQRYGKAGDADHIFS